MQAAGLLVDVNVGVSDGRLKQLWKTNQAPPPAVFARCLLDTGADTTMVDEQIMRTLGLTAINQRRVLTSESMGVAQLCDVYDVALDVVNKGMASWRLSAIQVLARPLMNDELHGGIGRDALNLAKLTYDGPQAIFTIDYWHE